MKKAIVERLKEVYHISWFPEDGPEFPIRVSFMKDIATIGIDTSGISLHKRGYRQMTVKAPITETLASALILLTPWNKDRILVDPFCGSGTFPIEHCDDRCRYSARYESVLSCRTVETSGAKRLLVSGKGRSYGSGKNGYRNRYSGV